jgi:hypothetical protein
MKTGKTMRAALALVAAGGIAAAGLGTAAASTTQAAAPVLNRTQLLTIQQVAAADPGGKWIKQVDRGILPKTYCGPTSTEGKRVSERMARGFTDDMAMYGAQYVSRYPDVATAKAAYASIKATLKSCPAGKPAPTHTRKLTDNRVVAGASGDGTVVIRWYDYPLPSDPGSEDGAFPYVVTLKGRNVSVLAFSSMGQGISRTNVDKVARLAAAKITR